MEGRAVAEQRRIVKEAERIGPTVTVNLSPPPLRTSASTSVPTVRADFRDRRENGG